MKQKLNQQSNSEDNISDSHTNQSIRTDKIVFRNRPKNAYFMKRKFKL